MKAPLGVQLNRTAFILYALLFAWPFWRFRESLSVDGIAVLGSFVFCSLLGLGYSFVRMPRSRWILAVFGLAIPGVFLALMCLMVFRRPAWWEWPFALLLWFTIPITLAVSLFMDKKTREYFTT